MTLDEIVSTYCSAWNEKDENARGALLEASWSANDVYEDPFGVISPGWRAKDDLLPAAYLRHVPTPGGRQPLRSRSKYGNVRQDAGTVLRAYVQPCDGERTDEEQGQAGTGPSLGAMKRRSSASTASIVGKCRAISCQFSPSSKLANTEPLFVPK
jgi:hypothetical protein